MTFIGEFNEDCDQFAIDKRISALLSALSVLMRIFSDGSAFAINYIGWARARSCCSTGRPSVWR